MLSSKRVAARHVDSSGDLVNSCVERAEGLFKVEDREDVLVEKQPRVKSGLRHSGTE